MYEQFFSMNTGVCWGAGELQDFVSSTFVWVRRSMMSLGCSKIRPQIK